MPRREDNPDEDFEAIEEEYMDSFDPDYEADKDEDRMYGGA